MTDPKAAAEAAIVPIATGFIRSRFIMAATAPRDRLWQDRGGLQNLEPEEALRFGEAFRED